MKYADDIHNYLVYFTGSQDVDDLVQETFVRVLRSIHTFRGQSSPKVWLHAIARNVAIDSVRKKRRMPAMVELSNEVASTTEDSSFEDTFMTYEMTLAVLELLQRVSPKYRDVLVLRAIQGLSSAETAEVLGWTPTRVNVAYHRARKIARKHFSDGKGRWTSD